MDKSTIQGRFTFLAEAFQGVGGFAPRVTWRTDRTTTTTPDGRTVTSTRRVPELASSCHLVPYLRESDEKYAGRCAVAVYENHLREACERFVGFLGRRRPMRQGVDAPLVQLLLDDADQRGTPLDLYLRAFALEAKARGSMLLLVDMPDVDEQPISLADQIERRVVPRLRTIAPESVTSYEQDEVSGLFTSLRIACLEVIDGKATPAEREWTAEGWAIYVGDRKVREGAHPFGICPVLAFTENGLPYPQVGKFAQVADLSLSLYNARSERDEILRGQTFSLLTLQVPPEQASFDPAATAATIGTHSILVHAGDTPAFIAPDPGPAQTYLAKIEELQQSIRRITAETATEQSGTQESGVARRLRFEALNADIATFATGLQSLERKVWALFHRALGTTNRVVVEWPTDYNLIDTLAELDILAAMQATGMPPAVLNAKRRVIAAAEFDTLDEERKAALLLAIDEIDQESATPDQQPLAA